MTQGHFYTCLGPTSELGIWLIDEELSMMFTDLYSGAETNIEEYHDPSRILFSSLPPFSPMLEHRTTTSNLAFTTKSSLSDTISTDDTLTSSTTPVEYQPRSLSAYNIERLSILPIYPPFRQPLSMTKTTSDTPHLLLTNVPIHLLTEEQYNRLQYGAFTPLFRLEMDVRVQINAKNPEKSSCESFLLFLYQQLHLKIKKRLKIDIPIIDFNLTRLHQCIDKVVAQRHQQQTMLNMDELPLALEFYLQFDVNMFFLKTCSFNGVRPRIYENRFREGVFCIDPPEARFVILPCNKSYCDCCHTPCPHRHDTNNLQQQERKSSIIPFANPHIHRFVNQYEAILNCSATCETKNSIYVLTCFCGQFDFIGETKLSFADALAYHRKEGNRIIRKVLIGQYNIQNITHGLKSDEKNNNDIKWLYQHSTCCSIPLQHFLDYNPDYWCFVPMKSIDIKRMNNTTVRNVSTRSTTETVPILTIRTRSNEEVQELVENLPKPPFGFDFSLQQQVDFFKYSKDHLIQRYDVDLYYADIVAILPDSSSELFRQLIESLFITHAECKLNDIGHLVYENIDPNRGLHSSWCANLTHRST